MATKPSIPKGTRDFGPVEMLRRKYIFSTIEKVFQKYGYLPLETPAMENLETLTGKYGEEGDRLIFKILQRGEKLDEAIKVSVGRTLTISEWFQRMKEMQDRLNRIADPMHDSLEPIRRLQKLFGPPAGLAGPSPDGPSQTTSADQLSDLQRATEPPSFNSTFRKEFEPLSADMALRYDLTVPFARYVVAHQNELAFPFKRYQIQPVWRADRPQKGRYREFYQCDADVIGSTSLLNEVELIQMIDEVFQLLGLKVRIVLNSRKLLGGLAKLFLAEDRFMEFVTILDKFDKVGTSILDEYKEKGFSAETIQRIGEFLAPTDVVSGTPELARLQRMFLDYNLDAEFEAFQDFMKFKRMVVETLGSNTKNEVLIDYRLARGLDYYTGLIVEVKAAEGTLQSSICGGGRYDDLTGVFGLKGMSGVGISFGADRIYDVLLETNKFPAELGSSTKLLFANFGEKEAIHCLKLLREVREAGIAAELYPDQAKLPKQFTYAEKKGIPYVAIVGETEMNEGVVTLKKMGANEKGTMMPIAEMIALLKDQS